MIWFLFFVTVPMFSLTDGRHERIPLTCAQKKLFVDGHNFRRYDVAQGSVSGQPAATYMTYMMWDEELAQKAAAWAEKGAFKHNPDKTIGSNRWKMIGENIYRSQYYSTEDVKVLPDIEEVLGEWFNEHRDYEYEPYKRLHKRPIGHYTQMVWADTTHLGCGITQKKDNFTELMYVCNYAPTGNFIGRWPYTASLVKGHLRCSGKNFCSRPYGKFC